MSYLVLMTDTAKQDLRDIAVYIARQSEDIEAAKTFVDKLRGECSRLREFPGRGAFPADYVLKSLGYRFIVYSDYLVFYLIDEAGQTVDIMAIINDKRNYRAYIVKYKSKKGQEQSINEKK